MKKLERVLLLAFLATILWIAAGWMRPKPLEVELQAPLSTGGAGASASSAKAPAQSLKPSAEVAVPKPPAKVARSPFADQPGTFAIDPFSDGGPAAVAVFPEPPRPQLPPEERDLQDRTTQSE